MTGFEHVAANLREIRARITAACEARVGAARETPAAVQLVAVSKTHPAEAVIAALEAGQRVFGENRVQEAAAKFPALRASHPDLKLHLIGPLQTNKVRLAVETCDAIQTLDRDKLAEALAAELAKQGKRLDLFVQVNTGEEPQKSGIAPGALDRFVAQCRDEFGLTLAGLMAIPPEDDDVALHAALLTKLAARNDLAAVSIGMSGDFEPAIQFGATHVRVGTAIFGARVAQEV